METVNDMQPYYQDDLVTLYHGCWEDVLPALPDGAFDAIITDPPYGYNVDKLTPWDRPVSDIPGFTAEVRRLAREFYGVFGQMPHLAPWHQAATEQRLHFCEHIVWVKRNCTPGHRLKRGHESVLVYATGGRKQFYATTGPYEDVKVPGVLVDAISLEAIQRHLGFLRQMVNGTLPETKKSMSRSPHIAGRFGEVTQLRQHITRATNYTNVWSFLPPNHARRTGRYGHPTAKPLPIMERLVGMLTPPGGAVLDPFAGSGTTLIAARALGRRAVGVELHEEFCEMAVERLSQTVMPLSGGT